MKKFPLFYLLILISILSFLACNPDDQSVMVVDDEMSEPMDTIDMPVIEDPIRTYSTESHSIGDWGIEIYVPSDYDSTQQYPIIYYNDGDLFSDVFGFMTSVDVPAFIMVGISGDNSRAERFLDYNDPVVSADLGDYTPSASIYSDAIVNDIMPFVEDKFTINANKKAFFGISLGGLHATWIAVKYPQVFNFIGALSPSYWVANEAIFEEDLSVLKPPGLGIPTKIYYDRGSSEWRNHLSFVPKLETAGLIYGKSIFYYEVIGANHSSEDWQLRIDIPFKIFLEGIGFNEAPTQLDFRSYCAFDLTNNNANTTRANPIVQYENGIKFSIISDAEYTINQGSGSIADDGTYNITNGSSMVVEAAYQGLTDVATLNNCN